MEPPAVFTKFWPHVQWARRQVIVLRSKHHHISGLYLIDVSRVHTCSVPSVHCQMPGAHGVICPLICAALARKKTAVEKSVEVGRRNIVESGFEPSSRFIMVTHFRSVWVFKAPWVKPASYHRHLGEGIWRMLSARKLN